VERALKSEHIDLYGIHFHIGSQLSENDSHVMAVKIILELLGKLKEKYGFTARELNCGGGFGVHYAGDPERLPISAFTDEMMKLIDEFYESIGFFERKDNFKIFDNLTNRKAEEYPILSDFLNYIKRIYEKEEDEFRKERIDKIKLKLTKLVTSNGILFDGYSTIDIQNEDLVVFNIKELATLPQEIFSAVIFNILSILWEEMINNVDIEKIGDRVDDFDIKKYFLLLDEAHRILNDELDDKIIKFFIDFQREARKYMGSIWFSYHTIDDAIKESEESKKMNQLFNLSQYKIVFEQDNQLKNKLFNVFKNNFNESEIDAISKFQIGECILSLHNQNNVIFKISLGLDEEKELIATGGK